MVRGRAIYEGTAMGNLTAYKPDRVSLPESVQDAPWLTSLLGPADRTILEDKERMRRNIIDYETLLEDHPITPYTDPVSKIGKRQYTCLCTSSTASEW